MCIKKLKIFLFLFKRVKKPLKNQEYSFNFLLPFYEKFSRNRHILTKSALSHYLFHMIIIVYFYGIIWNSLNNHPPVPNTRDARFLLSFCLPKLLITYYRLLKSHYFCLINIRLSFWY